MRTEYRYSFACSGPGGTLYNPSEPERQPLRPVPLLERRAVELELQLARQRLERQQSVCRSRNSLHFSPAVVVGEFCFTSWPFHPPSIFPISSMWTDRAIYFLLSIDFDSHKTNRSILKVSNFLIANLTQGSFSVFTKKLAQAMASMISINKKSILWPREYLWIFGSVWYLLCHSRYASFVFCNKGNKVAGGGRHRGIFYGVMIL